MTDKELKRLSRSELVEMLIAQMEENEKLKTDLEKTREKADSRQIAIDRAGSIAEAALALNGVFDTAQAAAAQYLENIRQLSGNQEAVCQRMEASAREKARTICAEADAYNQKIRTEADMYSQKLRTEADVYNQKLRTEADAYSRKVRSEADLYRKRAAEKLAALLREKDGSSSLLHPNKEGGQA